MKTTLIRRILNWLSWLIPAALLLGGVYILLCATGPMVFRPAKIDSAKLPVAANHDQLVIDKLGLALPILQGDQTVLEKGVWHRYPERGDPDIGGNFILAGHRFLMGNSPFDTVHRSPLYHVDELKPGDPLTIDWHGKRYTYHIQRIYSVKPDDNAVEASSTKPKLTLYTCSNGGSADGRIVIEAVK